MRGTCAGPLKNDAGGGMPETTPFSRRVVARMIRTSESLSGPHRLERTQGSMPSKAAKAPAIPTPESTVGQGPSATGRRSRLGAGLVVLILIAVLLASPRAAAGTFPVSVEQILVGT